VFTINVVSVSDSRLSRMVFMCVVARRSRVSHVLFARVVASFLRVSCASYSRVVGVRSHVLFVLVVVVRSRAVRVRD
jgi:hypothetical protein